MTQGSSNPECEKVIKDLTAQFGKESWFLTAYIDRDDHGPHVVVKVVKDNPDRKPIRHPDKTVKICTYLMHK